ncbi:hypothetical protein D3P06_15590 [Paracoccus aestuarii]|uniref:Sulfotransferase family protein n=2 Tax=Paracoccus aestuarii TaxID=453842 RepID=A0A418ZQV9_9RHOB|nr:hypothetical protein D3P06_15590 [Paracoccus aestuarii]WCR00413.1 hypothetical protein JHW48_07035 [Paracoccus aestuarii]
MQMVFHLGVHCTDGDRLLKTLLNNRAALQKAGTEIVTPNRHRGLFDEALKSLNGGSATPEMEQIMLDAMLESDDPSRVVMSTPTFMGAPGRAVGRDGLYPQIGMRAAALARLFPSARTEFFVAIRNPATLISEVLPMFGGKGYPDLMQGCHPTQLRWRDAAQRLMRAAQGRRVVMWCHEDVPLIWPEVVRLAGALPPEAPLSGGLLYMHDLLGDAGIARLRDAMAGRDRMDIAQRRQLYAQVLEAHALPGMLDQEIALPGWSQDLVDEVTAHYRSDVAEIAVMPGVEFLLP